MLAQQSTINLAAIIEVIGLSERRITLNCIKHLLFVVTFLNQKYLLSSFGKEVRALHI